MYVCIHVQVHVRICACIYICIYTVFVYIRIYMHECMYILCMHLAPIQNNVMTKLGLQWAFKLCNSFVSVLLYVYLFIYLCLAYVHYS